MPIVAVLVVVGWAGTTQPRSPGLTQDEYYQLATQSECGTFSRYPEPREVIVHPVDKTYLALAFEYVRRAASRSIETAGRYEDQTRTVRLESEFVCASAGLPGLLRLPFEHSLRHEYGHAFVEDVLKAADAPKVGSGDEMYLAYTESTMPRECADEISCMPPELQPVLEEWRTSQADIYRLPYFTSTFNEYLAESYARYLGGYHVPDATRRYLESHTGD